MPPFQTRNIQPCVRNGLNADTVLISQERVESGHLTGWGTARCRPRYLAPAGGVIAVEYPMNYLRRLISKWIEALRGRSFPRRVTAPNGSARWQGSSGRSFETLEEAYHA